MMINREERRARIKMQIAKAVSEIDHGDSAAAVLALADGLNAMLHYVENGDALLAARLEGRISPMSEEVKEHESFAGLPEEQQPSAGDPAVLAKQRKRR